MDNRLIHAVNPGIGGIGALVKGDGLEIGKKVVKVFHPQKLNPDDAKVIVHPVDYVVFNGMKDNKTEELKKILLKGGEKRSTEGKKIQKGIMKAVDNGNYEWITLRVENEGRVNKEK